MPQKTIIGILLLALIVGCNSSSTQNSTQAPAENPTGAQAAPQDQPPPPPPPPPDSAVAQDSATKRQSRFSEPVAPTPRPGMKLEQAGVGSGDKGRGYGQGMIATPAATYWAVREKLMFEVTIPKCIEAYKFEHDFKGPKTHEEFMEKIVKKYSLKLPTLPPGHQYVYDPKSEKLMVEKPQE